MSSIRLFILSTFADFGPMHGHMVRTLAEKMKVPLWTDISVGAVYGAMKRLAGEGLLREQRSEREGNRPTRQVYEITDDGRRVLDQLRREGLSEVWLKPDPFDLALTRMDAKTQKQFPAIIAERLKNVRAVLTERKRTYDEIRAHVGPSKQWAMRHGDYRLEAEIAYLSDLLRDAKAIVAEDRAAQIKKIKLR
ncbi:MAG TPA: helix-turn-helix transcriptional regulator [Rhizomicrobium sp.]|nr:helix-turn-helix transcriptional regulator [Rhizomicrobium sp.]